MLVRAGKNVVSAFVHWKAAWAYITQDILVVPVEDIQSLFYIFIVASDRLFLLRVELDFAINSHVAKYENFDIHFFFACHLRIFSHTSKAQVLSKIWDY